MKPHPTVTVRFSALLTLIIMLILASILLPASLQAAEVAPSTTTIIFLPLVSSGKSSDGTEPDVEIPVTLQPGDFQPDDPESWRELRRQGVFAEMPVEEATLLWAALDTQTLVVKQALEALSPTAREFASEPTSRDITMEPVEIDGARLTSGGTAYYNDLGTMTGMGFDITAVLPSGSKVSQQMIFNQYAKSCPEAGGLVPGEAKAFVKLGATFTADGILTNAHVLIDGNATVQGQVNRGARLQSWDIDATINYEISIEKRHADSGALISNQAERYRARVIGQGLSPDGALTDAQIAKIKINIWGSKGRFGIFEMLFKRNIAMQVAGHFSMMFSRAHGELERAEKHWYDEEKCVTLGFDPAPLMMASASSAKLSVHMIVNQEQAETEADLQATISKGSIAPANETSTPGNPARFTVTLPPKAWDGGSPIYTIVGTSVRGKQTRMAAVLEVKEYVDVDLQGGLDWRHTMEDTTIHYRFVDDDARSIQFTNPYAVLGEDAPSVFVSVRMAGSEEFVAVDWTNEDRITYCRDLFDERVSELVITVTVDPAITLPVQKPELVATNIGCWRWKGSTEYTVQLDQGESFSESERLVATVTFEAVDEAPQLAQAQVYKVVSGEVMWERNGIMNECTFSGGPDIMPIQLDDGRLEIFNYAVAGDGHRYYMGTGTTGFDVNIKYVCDGQTFVMGDRVTSGWFHTSNDRHIVSTRGDMLAGESIEDLAMGESRSTWHFKAERQ
jgi:hypothetical protein